MTRLKDICELIVDCPHSTAQDEGQGYPLIRTPNIGRGRFNLEGVHRVSENVYRQRNLRATPRDDDLIFAREAPAGNVAIIKNGHKFCLGQRTVLIRPNKEYVSPDFLTYFLLAPQQQYGLLGTANGATVAHVNLPTIRDLEIDLPPLKAQLRIANILSAYDDLIENNRKQIKLLEEAAQRLYKEWFVDLRFPGHEHTKIVNGVPKGWEKRLLGDIVEVKYGKDHKSIPDGLIPVYGSGGFMRKCNQILFDGESVLIPRKGSLNNIIYVDGAFWTVDTMFYTRMKLSNAGIFVYFFIKSFDMYSMNIGAAVPSMTTNILNALDIIVPSSITLEQFQSTTKMYFHKIERLQKQIETAMRARDRLLPKLMSGEVEV